MKEKSLEWVIVKKKKISGKVFKFEEDSVHYGQITKENFSFYDELGRKIIEISKKEVTDFNSYFSQTNGK